MTVEEINECISECLACIKACNIFYGTCLQEEDLSMMKKCIQLDRDCADICALAVQYMTTQSSFAKEICRLCADICEACAEECTRHNHEHCQKCAKACRRCPQACRKMAA
ncbi:four-helix bundle copper-binding protein [Aneurinibacillus sp. Ricciae_BoGa-3]|uniref:four-helix bundle copper-binding protein n=1 Tax=Aneurinibacillus sp. Ricciae_BoGa-3 TaxID=3022697 RepID=UPI0023427A42|nr:four-helix bundle copper-binding protein [Aneurinibacillus sp. Ricciae_BoGa-3]WCK52966.1 four-helix bundle copper-binding protein [Aneurinibacillus sp. Ricciae_BoGa-3]